MLDIHIDTGQFASSLENKAELIFAACRAQMTIETGNLLAYIKDEKLSGQVLTQRSGNLVDSGRSGVTTEAQKVAGYVGFGSTVPYARIHNYGGTIEIPEVSGKLMVFERGGETIFTRRHRAFTVHMPERNFMESSVADREAAIREGFNKAISEALNA